MPLSSTMAGFFTEEWERFREGTRMLDIDAYRLHQAAMGRTVRTEGDQRTINIPGWDDVIKLGERYRPTQQERTAYYTALRRGGRAQISEQAQRAMDDSRQLAHRMRNSATPDFAKGLGQIMTAIDNVQDFLSTVATFGRLVLWAGPRAVTRLSPYLPIIAPVVGRVGARVGAYAIPGLGWIITAADLLNWLGMLGLIATPVFGLLCAGPTKALAAGLPSWMMRCSLRQEAWKLAQGGVFGKRARADALRRTQGRLPGFSNLVEVAQTTEQLWGWGASFGGLVGMMSESAGAAFDLTEGKLPQITYGEPLPYWNRVLHPRLSAMSAGERDLFREAGRLAATAPAIHRTQDHFTEQEHIEALAMTLVAYGTLQTVWKGLDVEQAISDALDTSWTVPTKLSRATLEHLEDAGAELHELAAWTLPGSPARVTGAEYVAGYAPLIAQATLDFLEPRRNRPLALFYSQMLTEAMETSWLLATQNRDALRFELGDDAQLTIALAESGYLLNPEQGESVLWPFWLAARREIIDGPRRTLYPDDWRRLAAAHGVTLVPFLTPESPFPPEWTQDTPPV